MFIAPRERIHMVVEPLDIEREWLRHKALITKALPFMYGSHNELDAAAAVLDGEIQFWVGPKSFVFSSIDVYPRTRRLNLLLANGDYDGVCEIFTLAEQWAKKHHAVTQVICTVRNAVKRRLDRAPAAGWRNVSHTYLKEI